MFCKIHICALLLSTLFLELSYTQSLTRYQPNVNFFRENNQEKYHNIVTSPVNKISLENLSLTNPSNSYNNQNNIWVSIGPYGGDVRSLAISTIDTNIIYAGTGDAGIYKSENSGLTWSFSQFANSWSHHLVIHPGNDSTVYGVVLLENGYGVIAKTTNAGISWRHTEPVFPFFCVTIDKINPNVCYGGGGGAIYKTTDGGESGWYYSGLSGELVYDVAVSPIKSNTVFAGVYPNHGTSLYISQDSGTSWVAAQTPSLAVNVIVPDYSDSLIVYMGAGGFYKSTNGGYNWYLTSLIYGVYDIEIDPYDPNIVYASSGLNVYRSTNKGEDWEAIGIETKFFSQSIIVNPQNSNTLLTGTFSYGIFKTYNIGNNWFESHTGLDNIRTRDVEIDPVDPKTIYVAADGQGVYKSTDNGSTWEIKDNGLEYPYNTWGLTVAVNPHNNNEVYYGTLSTVTTSDWCLYKSTNKGELWFPLTNTEGREWVNSIVVDLEDSNSVYAATNAGFMISNDKGQSWIYIYPDPFDPSLYAFVIDPNNPEIFYASNWWSNFGIYKSTNKGLDWIQKNDGIISPRIKALAIDYSNSSTLYSGTDNHIYKTEDATDHWDEVFEYDSLTETMALLVNYANQSYLYAGTTYSGMFVSYDAGITWSDFDDGFYNSNPEIYALGSSPAEPHIIYSATWNHSLYKYFDTTLVPVGKETVLPKEFYLSQNYPNPFNPSTLISYQMPVSSNVTIKVFDVLGKEIATLVNEYKPAGTHQVEFNTSYINHIPSSGVYFYQVKAGEFVSTKKMILLK